MEKIIRIHLDGSDDEAYEELMRICEERGILLSEDKEMSEDDYPPTKYSRT